MLASIAPDEARHASLAWRVHSWLFGLLTASERGMVQRAMRRAAERAVEVRLKLGEQDRAALGLPDDGGLRRIAVALADALWS